jgi:hypothetical protein
MIWVPAAVITTALAVLHWKTMVVPVLGEAGSVAVEAPMSEYPFAVTAVNTPLVSDQVNPSPLTAIVIEPAPLVILIPAPSVIVASTGVVPVLPITICPFVATPREATALAAPPINVPYCVTALAVIAEVPFPVRMPVSVTAPVPPPATTAVPNVGFRLTPWLITGIPLVDEGLTDATAFAASPMSSAYRVTGLPVHTPTLESVCIPALVAFRLLSNGIILP